MKTTALIMAGGRGERFWPKSRVHLPKQFLSLTDDGKTMIQLTVERISSLVDIEDVYIATNEVYKNLVLEQLPGLPEQNVLCEPIGRNTAPCIGLGAVHIASKYEDAIMMVLPSDHLIRNNRVYTNTLQDACDIAKEGDNLVTLGITPDYPETGYGYIKFDEKLRVKNGYAVDCFVEKPDFETAEMYYKDGNYLWNSGMFIWKVSSILKNFTKYMPETYDKLLKIKESLGRDDENAVLQKVFPEFESQSIDYGIMEKAEHIYILPGAFGWDDVGSWLSVGRIKKSDTQGNVVNGNVVSLGNENCVIECDKRLIAVIGMKNTVVVDTDDITLICDENHTADIKKVLAKLREDNKKEYL